MDEKYSAIISTLPCRKSSNSNNVLFNYQNFWYPKFFLPSIMAIEDHFVPRPSDLFVVTSPKSGSTWLKAIIFAIVNRKDFPSDSRHPLLASSPHAIVPFLHDIYSAGAESSLEEMPSPRLLALHTPHSSLPSSVINSGCRMIYMCRDPKDNFVSLWHYLNKVLNQSLASLEEVFEMFSEGCSFIGPVWEHALEYWRASLEQPDRICFVKYEEMKKEPVKTMRRIAEFVGFGFSEEEVDEGVVERIVDLCSFEKLSNVQANKYGVHDAADGSKFENSAFFRKGEVGGWEELLSLEMAERLDRITEDKFRGSGLTFQC